jgi:hypothetical protein
MHAARLDSRAGHTEHDAGAFVFGEDACPFGMEHAHTHRAIAPHARQNGDDHLASVMLGDGEQGDVHCGAHAMQGRFLREMEPPIRLETQMHTAGREIGDTGLEPVAFLRLPHMQVRKPIQSLGEGASEALRHVLNDEHRRHQFLR